MLIEGEYYMEHGSVAHRGEKIHNISAKIGPDFFSRIFSFISFNYFGSEENIRGTWKHFKMDPPTIKINYE